MRNVKPGKRNEIMVRLSGATAMMALVAVASIGVRAAEKEIAMPPAGEILKTLKPIHPRLIIDEGTVARVKKLVAGDPNAARWYESIKANANKILGEAPSKYEIPDGKRLLSVSRRVKERVQALAFVFLMEGDQRRVERAWAELEAASKFKDWNPSHFLDTAEMTYAFAIGYDWLYKEWSDEQRRVLREAIRDLGLKPAMKVYESGGGWPKNDNNWNQVCNGGIGCGALAIADVEPHIAAAVLGEALKSLPRAMGYYAPDGAGTEGVTYWSYGTRFNLLFLSALETALGTDFGLSQIGGFGISGDYQIYLAGADRVSFDFGDCGKTRMSTPQHFWLGRRYDRPGYSWYRYSELQSPKRNGDILDLLWYDDRGKDFDVKSLPLDKYFRKAEIASLRSAWGDPNALVVGFEGGHNSTHGHRHLDLGSFILEASGVRWAIDSGMEHETYLVHNNKHKRWEFYRVRAEGHNTLVINPDEKADQEIEAFAPIVKFESTPKRALAVEDLTEAYKGRASHVQRELAMIDRAYVTVTDTIKADKPADVWWFMHTGAEAEIGADKSMATLTENGKRLSAQIISPKGAAFSVMEAAPFPSSPNPEKQAGNKGRRKLAIHLAGVKEVELKVKLRPEP